MKSGIVQIYQLDENADYQDETKIPFKVKIPLCLGALISHKHVLTTKLCFGEYLRHVAAKMPFEQQESCHLYLELKFTLLRHDIQIVSCFRIPQCPLH